MSIIIYLDNAATTKPDKEILSLINETNLNFFGNPSSIYFLGQESKNIIKQSQNKIANLLNCNPQDILFTSGGTESNNLAIFGSLKKTNKKHIITTSIEHLSVLNTIKFLESEGYKVTYLPINSQGKINLKNLLDAITEDTALISVMYVNNEIGSIQDIKEIGIIAKKYKILFHCDAIQAINLKNINLKELNIDFLSISGHKIYTPKGIGLLYARNLNIENILYGGHQQYEKRPGTENVGNIAGLALAIEKFSNKFDVQLQNYAIEKLKNLPNIIFNGVSESHILNFRIPNINNEFLIIKLGTKNIYISGGSACNSSEPNPSHVLKALGLTNEECKESIRISIGKDTTKKDINEFIKALSEII